VRLRELRGNLLGKGATILLEGVNKFVTVIWTFAVRFFVKFGIRDYPHMILGNVREVS
jgi:hypothetical protein